MDEDRIIREADTNSTPRSFRTALVRYVPRRAPRHDRARPAVVCLPLPAFFPPRDPAGGIDQIAEHSIKINVIHGATSAANCQWMLVGLVL